MDFNAYITQMSAKGTWCDHIIIQAVANAFHCIINISHIFQGCNSSKTCDLVFFLQALSQKYTMYQQYVSLEILLQFVKT